MRIANVCGRLTLVTVLDPDGVPGRGLDVEKYSCGRFGSDPQGIYDDWDSFVDWAREHEPLEEGELIQTCDLGSPVPKPTQVFAIGLNYQAHADETKVATLIKCPSTFTKFPTCISGPFDEVALPPGSVDWEIELVAVISRPTYRIDSAAAWEHVAGVAIGQDLSEREMQMAPPLPQFSLAKSFPGFGPIGPALVTVDELDNPDDLHLECSIDDVVVQDAQSSQMIYTVPAIISWLSSVVPLRPGDVIFTGTPEGVGMGMEPPRFLHSGEVITSRIEGLGEMRTPLVRASSG